MHVYVGVRLTCVTTHASDLSYCRVLRVEVRVTMCVLCMVHNVCTCIPVIMMIDFSLIRCVRLALNTYRSKSNSYACILFSSELSNKKKLYLI